MSNIRTTGGPTPGFSTLTEEPSVLVINNRVDGSGPHADDDEFTGDETGTPTGWTAVQDSTPRWSFRTLSSSLHAYTDGALTSDTQMEALVKAMPGTPTAPITIETAINLQFTDRSTVMGGLCFLNGTTWSTADGVFAGEQVVTFISRAVFRNVLNMAFGGQASSEEDIGEVMERLYVRLVWESANTWTVLHSPDGVGWVQWSNRHNYSHTLAPTHMGFIFSPWFGTAGDPGTMSFEYFRVYEEAKTEGLD